MIFSIIRIILGLSFTLFIPGYLLSLILFRKLKIIERICLSFGLSVVIVVFFAFFLTLISNITNAKGITTFSVWLSLLTVSIIFIILIFAKYKKISKIPFLEVLS